ncbi:hypothetical protein EMIHUDRAFT_254308 [Emiliania huxleyi CCMP1516]|uniref:Uncharacterized protein n=2 Tax=Emiliania huxleyi TaxID=2903 RepID=A0A0D3JV84_EMIH1|nr:hypothetical protein EMIHUDRAFT_254308 [Emiliania huxleyi CCMP1516]EOD27419.1 hypothetical protein EMIHUDRAFT_254308 [Emiliania huxleyi CCMP1516]|eukprot:XP_005779848.1 hypothetical protein EMIHUDRAFT_254308 [Emiliania huxleyi CCMP1516]
MGGELGAPGLVLHNLRPTASACDLEASACFHGPLTVASAAANGQFARDSSGCGFCAVLIMLTSVNYWRHPLLGPRRTFDMASSVACFFYQLRASTSAPSGACLAYCATSAGILGCYGFARHYMYSLGNKPAACRWHLMVHGFTGAGSLILYDALGQNYLGWRCEKTTARVVR